MPQNPSPGEPPVRWHEVPDRQSLQRAALERVLHAAATAIAERGQFRLVLSGGETPRALYTALRTARADWAAWHIYYGDERCVETDAATRNSRMAAEVWLDHVPIPAGQNHPIPAELGAVSAAAAYIFTVKGVGDFDLVLLGLGEDGHTASLFPGHDWGSAAGAPDVLPVLDAPKPPPERVSLSAPRLSRTHGVLFLVSGESKHAAVDGWRNGKPIPAAAIRPAAGVDVLLESTLLVPLAQSAKRSGSNLDKGSEIS